MKNLPKEKETHSKDFAENADLDTILNEVVDMFGFDDYDDPDMIWDETAEFFDIDKEDDNSYFTNRDYLLASAYTKENDTDKKIMQSVLEKFKEKEEVENYLKIKTKISTYESGKIKSVEIQCIFSLYDDYISE